MKRVACLILVLVCLVSPSYGTNLTREAWEYSFIKALNYEEKGDFDRAIVELERAYQEKPKELLILRELAYCYGHRGELSKAKELYQRVLEIDSQDENALKNIELIEALEKK